jgi:hypothetical protein
MPQKVEVRRKNKIGKIEIGCNTLRSGHFGRRKGATKSVFFRAVEQAEGISAWKR